MQVVFLHILFDHSEKLRQIYELKSKASKFSVNNGHETLSLRGRRYL